MNTRYRPRSSLPLVFLAALLICGCVVPGELQKSPEERTIEPLEGFGTLAKLPFKEAWYGMYFQDEKIGFSHFLISKSGDNFKIVVESDMRLKSMRVVNKILTRERVIVRPDLTLIAFESRVTKNDRELKVRGRVERDRYILAMETGGEEIEKTFELEDQKLRHNSAISLYPALNGLEDGRMYSFQVFKPETHSLETVKQQIYKVRGDPGPNGAVWKVNNILGNSKVISWLNSSGMVVIERAASGNLITLLEDEKTAKQMPSADGPSTDLALDWGLIRTKEKIENPSELIYLKLRLKDIRPNQIPSDQRQRKTDAQTGVELIINSEDLSKNPRPKIGRLVGSRKRYLEPTPKIQSDHEEIRALSRKIISRAGSEEERVNRLINWISKNIRQTPRDTFTALATLRSGEGECEAHANLYTALARASGIPTRPVQGLAYAPDVGFVYHAWAESYLDGWVAVDPTFGQTPADATHIKLFVGELSENAPKLMELVGGIQIKVLDYK